MMDIPCSGQTSNITESLCFVLLHSSLPLRTPRPPGSLRCAFLIQTNQSRAHTPTTSFIELSLDHNPTVLLITPGPVSDNQRQCYVPEPTIKVLAQVSSFFSSGWTSVLPGLHSPPAAHPGTGRSLFLDTVSNKLCFQWKCFRICCPYYTLNFLLICYILKQPCSSFFL